MARAIAKVRENYTIDCEVDGFKYTLDKSKENGGNGLGASPGGYLLAALAGCKAMVASAYCKSRGIKADIEVRVSDTWDTVDGSDKLRATVELDIKGEFDEKQKKILSKIAQSQCTVADIIKEENEVETRVIFN